ncbi:MAG: methyltransferase domain-containing protein [Bacillota bacterium]|nr:methyltransferase domain-containing protein [Bacillota bacterium]
MEHPPYSRFATIYDQVMQGVDYEMWARYVEELLRVHDLRAVTLVDLCCGTGSSTIPFARRGYRVVGVDRSRPMLEVARKKAAGLGLDIPFVEQDASSMDLDEVARGGDPPLAPGGFDLVVSLFDSLNYVPSLDDLEAVFGRVARALRPGGAFIFDLNSPEKLATMDNSVSLLEGDGYVLFWRNRFLPAESVWQVTLDGFLRQGGGWERFREVHREKAHPLAEVRERLLAAGLQVLGLYHAYTLSPARPGADRVFFLARRPSRRGSRRR